MAITVTPIDATLGAVITDVDLAKLTDESWAQIHAAFLEYAQARGFHIDAARVRHPRDKSRVERAVPGVRDDCFAGEILTSIDDARLLAVRWCRDEYGLRRHSRTHRQPREHFETEERRRLAAGPHDPLRRAALE
jgi:transposase